MNKAEVQEAFKAEMEPILKAQAKCVLKYGAMYAEAHAAETETKVDDSIVAIASPIAQAAIGQLIDGFKL